MVSKVNAKFHFNLHSQIKQKPRTKRAKYVKQQPPKTKTSKTKQKTSKMKGITKTKNTKHIKPKKRLTDVKPVEVVEPLRAVVTPEEVERPLVLHHPVVLSYSWRRPVAFYFLPISNPCAFDHTITGNVLDRIYCSSSIITSK